MGLEDEHELVGGLEYRNGTNEIVIKFQLEGCYMF